MKYKTIALLILAAALALPWRSAWAGGCPATINTSTASGAFAIGDASGVEKETAQSFTAPCGGTFSTFRVRFSTVVGTPSGDITWYLKGDSLGVPGATLTSGTITPLNNATLDITPITGITLLDGGTYWIQMTAPDQATNSRYLWTGSSVAYAGGSCFTATKNSGTWTDNASDCYLIMTIGPVAATNTPVNTSAPTDTPTPDNTLTPTITPSPTPDLRIVVTATSGNAMTLERSATFGDLVNFGGLLIVAACLLILFAWQFWKGRSDV